MSIEQKVKYSLKSLGKEIEVPEELDKVIIDSYRVQNHKKYKRIFTAKPLLIALLAIVLLVPTTAFAAYTLLADDIYGSFEQLKKKAVGMTMQGYLTFNAKLADAKGELGDQEYEKFKAAISSLASAKMTYGDTNGNINFEELPIEVVEELKATYIGLQPFFDRLNNLKSANEVLTESELEKYIAAEMTVETIAAKVGVPYVQSVKELPEEYQERYLEARNIMREVSEKQQLGYWKEELIND